MNEFAKKQEFLHIWNGGVHGISPVDGLTVKKIKKSGEGLIVEQIGKGREGREERVRKGRDVEEKEGIFGSLVM